MAIQTHMSENTAEVEQTLQLFPGCETYTEVYKKFGLLRRGTILAHCVWLSEKEIKMISESEAGISHCPTSNLNLMSGGARVGAMLDAGIHVCTVLISVILQPADSCTSWRRLQVGLGSDCSGGFALGVLSQVRNASMLSKLLALQASSSSPGSSKLADKPLSIPTLFHMATLGGAALCRAQDRIGNFLPGKEFDALRIRPGVSPGFFHLDGGAKGKEELEGVFEKWLFTSDDRDIRDVWVRGRRVAGSA
jgi:guanine deaminase